MKLLLLDFRKAFDAKMRPALYVVLIIIRYLFLDVILSKPCFYLRPCLQLFGYLCAPVCNFLDAPWPLATIRMPLALSPCLQLFGFKQTLTQSVFFPVEMMCFTFLFFIFARIQRSLWQNLRSLEIRFES